MTKNYEKAYKDYKRGMSYKDMAAKYSVSINTVKSWKTRQWAAMDAEKEKCTHKDTQVCTPEQAAQAIKEQKKAFNHAGVNKAKADAENIKAIQELTEYKKSHRPPAYEAKDIGKMIQRISNYFLICDEKETPYTRAGIIIALDISKSTFERYMRGELDYLIEEHIAINHIDLDTCDSITAENGSEIKIDCAGNPLISFSSVIQKALLRLEEQAEARLYNKGRPGDIFTMKQFGWTDERSPNTVNQTLVIASQDEADRALKMLYGNG